ncbi:hypothetical protein, partial [Staphylococcus aureus]|uniref:hypothetical protein n=1 Tax=Staphylococcus aureus TaxID=1280 RepID=UPI0039BDC902
VCVETLMLGVVFGVAGLLVGSGAVAFLHHFGIGATTQELYFFFSGPRLYPSLGPGNLILAFFIVMAVSLISTLYPAVIATRVSPLSAMQTEE